MRSKAVTSNDGAGSAYVKEMLISASYVVLLSVFGYSKAAATTWLQIHATAATPTANRVPEHTFAMGAADNFSMIIPVTGLPLDKCFLAVSSTVDKFTAVGTNDVTICATVQG